MNFAETVEMVMGYIHRSRVCVQNEEDWKRQWDAYILDLNHYADRVCYYMQGLVRDESLLKAEVVPIHIKRQIRKALENYARKSKKCPIKIEPHYEHNRYPTGQFRAVPAGDEGLWSVLERDMEEILRNLVFWARKQSRK